MNRLAKILICACALMLVFPAFADTAEQYADRIAALINPAKLSTLGKRGANPRVQKYVYQLAAARDEGFNPTNVVVTAIDSAGMKGAAARLTRDAMLRNLGIAEQLGCLGEAGLKEMKQGKAATVKVGPYTGDELSVDHIIPRSIVPELDNTIANLELMPLKMNKGKNDKVGSRQISLGKQLHTAGLLSAEGLRTLLK